jgi:hypothetical protein
MATCYNTSYSCTHDNRNATEEKRTLQQIKEKPNKNNQLIPLPDDFKIRNIVVIPKLGKTPIHLNNRVFLDNSNIHINIPTQESRIFINNILELIDC